MKARPRKQQVTIPNYRWVGCAVAGAATAFAGASSADAEIHYSGRVDVRFTADDAKSVKFPLDQPGESIRFGIYNSFKAAAFFEINGIRSEAFVGYSEIEYAFPFRLQRAQAHYISEGNFVTFYNHGTLYDLQGPVYGDWAGRGIGFLGFRFDHGAGPQYGWARVGILGRGRTDYIVLDYAYGDPGEKVKPGQTSSSSSLPNEGSLGLLAMGGAGLFLWRKSRKRAATPAKSEQ